MAKKKITVCLEQSVIDRIKGFAEENGIPFSGAVSILSTLGLTSWRFNPAVDLASYLDAIIKMGEDSLTMERQLRDKEAKKED